jgi:hypothetical protein
MAWKAADPSVIITSANLPNDGKLYLGTKVTYLGSGVWRYEYAIQNLNAAQAPLAISIPIPAGTTVSGSSYHDVDYHSGATQDNTPWARTTTATAVQWKANTLLLDGLVTNALRWGTLYNFRVDVNAAPGTHALLLGYNAPPAPTYGLSLSLPTLTPACATRPCLRSRRDVRELRGTSLGGRWPELLREQLVKADETEAACFADCGRLSRPRRAAGTASTGTGTARSTASTRTAAPTRHATASTWTATA